MGYGIAIVPSFIMIQDKRLRAVPIVVRGASIGHWLAVCWDPRRTAPEYLDAFVIELVAHARRARPGNEFLACAALAQTGGPFK